ncbi:unnamed protein product [Brassica oleracea var. botrytis]
MEVEVLYNEEPHQSPILLEDNEQNARRSSALQRLGGLSSLGSRERTRATLDIEGPIAVEPSASKQIGKHKIARATTKRIVAQSPQQGAARAPVKRKVAQSPLHEPLSFLFKNKMNDHKNLLQGGMQEENRAKKPISASPTRSQLVIANSNADLTGPSEVVFNVCCLCVYCPLCILWCCIKLPCAIGWRAIQKAGRHLGGCSGCGRSLSMKIKATDYSSFSDIDSDETDVVSSIADGVELDNVDAEIIWPDPEEDVLVANMEKCIQEGFAFCNSHFTGGASKADVNHMPEDAKKENNSLKTTKGNVNPTPGVAFDADYVVSILKSSLSADLRRIEEEIKKIGQTLTKSQNQMESHIQVMFDTFRRTLRM